MRAIQLASVTLCALVLFGSVHSQANPNPNDYNYGFVSNCQDYTNTTNSAGKYTCRTCMSGFTLNTDATVCYTCAANCNNCDTATGACTQCKTGFVLSNGNCAACPYNCNSCDLLNNKCLTCSSGYNLVNNGCLKCPINCASCSSATSCTACDKDFSTVTNSDGSVTCEVNTIKRFLTGTGIMTLGIILLVCALLAILGYCFMSGAMSGSPSYSTTPYEKAYSQNNYTAPKPQPVAQPMVPVVVTQPQQMTTTTVTKVAPTGPTYTTTVNPGYTTTVNPGYTTTVNPGYTTTVNPGYTTTGYQNAAYSKGYAY